MDNVMDPKTTFSEEPNVSPYQKAFSTDMLMWDYVEEPENAVRFRRINLAMIGTSTSQPPAAILRGPCLPYMNCGDVKYDHSCFVRL